MAASLVVCWSTRKPYVHSVTRYRRDESLVEANIGESVKTLFHPTSSEAPTHDVLFLVEYIVIIGLVVDS